MLLKSTLTSWTAFERRIPVYEFFEADVTEKIKIKVDSGRLDT